MKKLLKKRLSLFALVTLLAAIPTINAQQHVKKVSKLVRSIDNFSTNSGYGYVLKPGSMQNVSTQHHNVETEFSQLQPYSNRADDCGQGDDSNTFETALSIKIGDPIRYADDFVVSPNNTLNIKSILLNITSIGPYVDSLDFNFYDDDNGAPGSTVVHSLNGVVPYAQQMVGFQSGYKTYATYVEVDLNFEGGNSGATYWMQPVANGFLPLWEMSSVGTLGSPIYSSEDQGPWMINEDGLQAVFKLYCDVATPPDPECFFSMLFEVESITRVIMANVNNSSPANSTIVLEDFTSVMIMAESGGSYEVALEGNTNGTSDDYFTVFIDTGSNYTWETYETFEIGYVTNSTGTDGKQATAIITLPSSLQEGEHLLRVVKSSQNSPLYPCELYDFGQGEDYTLVIAQIVDCSGTPEGGIASVDPEEGNTNTNYNVYAIDYTVGNGLTYQWQSNTDGAGWVVEGSIADNFSSFVATAPSDRGVEVRWRLKVSCTFSQETAYSDIATFVTGSSAIYCIPELYCEEADVINNVTFMGIDNTTECSPDGYGDFTDMIASVQSGGTYPISVTVGGGWDYETVTAWIDFDDSGTFDEDEFYYIGTGSGETLPAFISIPANAIDGDYRMRFRVIAGDETIGVWDLSCDENDFYGETEDYTVTIAGVAGVNEDSTLNFTYYPNPMGTVLYIKANRNIESVSAYNILGQKVLGSIQYVDGKVDVSSLPTGNFLFRVTFESGEVENFRVLKK